MRITIDYLSLLDESFNSTITLDSNDDVAVLNQKLAELYGIPEKQQLLLYQRDSYTLKLIPGWPISHFCHEEEVTISLDIIGSLGCPDEFRLQLQNAHNYSMEIGSSRKVDELQRSKSGDSSTSRHSSLYFYKSDTSSEANSLTKAFSKQSDGLSILRPAAHSYTTQSKPLIQAAKNGNLEHLREYLREIKERGNSQVGPFLDECDHAGWNPLHWGIFRGQLGIVQDLVKEGADVNKQTKDEWTPLQLATYRNNLEITKVLLENEHIDVNRVTARTSAIHIAVKAGNVEIIRLLEQYGADLTLENDRGLKPSDLTTDGKIHILLSDLMAKAEEQTKKTNDHQRIVKGWILKKSVRLKILNSRYFVLNFAEGTFTRYKTLADYPHHPHETIFLTDIRTIKHKKQGFLDKKRYHYIELNCTRKCTLACRTQEMADQWVLYLSQAILYNQSAAKNLKIEDRKSFYVDNKAPKWIEEIEIHDYKMHGITVIREKEAKAESQHDQEKISLNDFSVLEEVGHGGFAKVFKVMKKSTGKYYALKTMRKQELMLKRSIKYAISEANILKKMNNPFVLKLHYAFQTKQHLCLVLDYCSGGTLLFHLSEKGVFSEEEARFYIAELILAIESLHAKDIIYRDLKPDNILIDHDGHVKLADFGLAREGIKNQSVAKSICGSPAYLAPEVVQGLGACKGTDMYGIGIILFEMLVGCAPYFSTDLQEMYNNIVSKKLEIPKKLSKDARDLIQKLVDRNPSKRLGTKNKAEIKKHPFFKEIDWAKLEKKEVRPPPGYGEETFDGKDDFIGPKSIELDKDDAIMIDNINHVPNFSFVAEPREENNWIYS